MRERKEIENEIQLDSEAIRDASLFNQALMIEVLLDVREAVTLSVIEHHIETVEEKKARRHPSKQ